ncbi:MAG TPA: DoxX family protein [Pseudonocardiaceae bacterium]
MRDWRNIVAWVLQVGLCLAMAGAGLAKLGGDDAMVELFADIGAGQWLRYLVGALELAGAVGLLVPRLRAAAAAGLLVLLLCATAVNLFVIDTNPLSALGFAVPAGAIVVLRKDELRRLAGGQRSSLGATTSETSS